MGSIGFHVKIPTPGKRVGVRVAGGNILNSRFSGSGHTIAGPGALPAGIAVLVTPDPVDNTAQVDGAGSDVNNSLKLRVIRDEFRKGRFRPANLKKLFARAQYQAAMEASLRK